MIYVALLKGINVGGHQPVAMADLRSMLTALRFENVRSLLQSGNLVFEAPKRKPFDLERDLEAEARRRLRLDRTIMVRTAAEWLRLVADNPFPREAARDPARMTVTFLKSAPSAARIAALERVMTGPETARVIGPHAYIWYPEGIGRSALAGTVVEKALDTAGTNRNWNTIFEAFGDAAMTPFGQRSASEPRDRSEPSKRGSG